MVGLQVNDIVLGCKKQAEGPELNPTTGYIFFFGLNNRCESDLSLMNRSMKVSQSYYMLILINSIWSYFMCQP